MKMAVSLILILLSVTAGAAVAWGFHMRRALRRYRLDTRLAALSADERAELESLRRALTMLHDQSRRSQTLLEETQRELAALTYSVSHDLRSPLRGIDGFSQALMEDYGDGLDPTARDYLRRVRDNALRMSASVDDLLVLSRVSSVPLRPDSIDLSALASEVAEEMPGGEPARGVQWDIQRGIIARGDRDLLKTALRHLFGNAWKFTALRPTARIGFRAVGAGSSQHAVTVYQVSDNGAGFDMQYAGKLFGVFQRMHAPEEFPVGRGIGLAVVQRIVHRHGGIVWAEATPEQGAVFSFTLENVAAGSVREPSEQPASSASASLAVGGVVAAAGARTTTV